MDSSCRLSRQPPEEAICKAFTTGAVNETTNPWRAWTRCIATVDGRDPAPFNRYSLSQYLQGFVHPRWLGTGFLNHPTAYYKE